MPIAKDHVVSFSYRLSEQEGSSLEQTGDAAPMAYLHGHNNIMPALEVELEGMEKDENKTVTLTPEQAYGERKANWTQKVPVKHLASKHKRLLPGTLVKLNTEKGTVDATVIKAGKFMVELDLNHPFAGKTLVFDITINDIRKASDDELAHGHAHGIGGHHH